MQSSSINHYKCSTNCKHRECQHHLGIVERKEMLCSKDHKEITGSSVFLENIIDLSHTLAQIMTLCGIHECKVKSAVDIITYSLLNYDLVCQCLDTKPSKRLRKEDIYHELGKKCLMNRIEAHLCYNIIKRGFKAFYYAEKDSEGLPPFETNSKKSFSAECLYVHAAKKTAESYGQFEGLSNAEQDAIEAKIQVVYKNFYNRLKLRKAKQAQENCCHCCYCAKSRGHLVYEKLPPSAVSSCVDKCLKKTENRKCCHCGKGRKSRKGKKERMIQSSKCSLCQRSRKFCSCEKYQFDINWICSIWCRPDMYFYYLENIETTANGCEDCKNECNNAVNVMEDNQHKENDEMSI